MPEIIKDFLSKDEIISLYKTMSIHAPNHGNIIEDSGRYIISTTNMSYFNDIVHIVKKIEDLVSKKYNKNMHAATIGFHLYSNEFGKPQLHPHIDEYAGEVVFDYQMDSNLSWPIKINKTEYTLNDNEALIFEGESSPHSRTMINFEMGQYLIMFIVNLISDTHWFNNSATNPKPIEEIKNEIEKIRKDKGNW